MKKVVAIIISVIALCGIAFGIGWGVTGTPDVTQWGKKGGSSAGVAVNEPAHIHTHATAMRAYATDENAGIELYASSLPSRTCPSCYSSMYVDYANPYPTCISAGRVRYSCDNKEECGLDEWVDLTNDPNNHTNMTYTRQLTAPTCTTDGSALYTCSGCGGTETRAISKTGHNYSWVITANPVGEEGGVESYICSGCSNVTETRKIFALPTPPEQEGHHFVGWYKDKELTIPYDRDYIYEDMDLNAKYEINVCTVTFDSDGGTAVNSVTTNWNTPLTTATPTKTGYNFVGWFKSDGTQFTDGEAVKGDMALTAHWQIKVFTVTFYVNGEVFTTVKVEYGSVLGDVANTAEVFARNIVSFENLNSATPNVSAYSLMIMDDMRVVANEPTAWDRVIPYLPYIIGGVCGLILIGVVTGLISNKKSEPEEQTKQGKRR